MLALDARQPAETVVVLGSGGVSVSRLEQGQLMGMLDKRLVALGTDYVDLLFIHSFGDNHTLDDAIAMVKSKELKEASDAAKRSGKARFVGISTHHKDRAQLIQAAAEGGIVDVIMLQYRPWLDKDSPLNKAIDAAHKRGIGLIYDWTLRRIRLGFAAPRWEFRLVSLHSESPDGSRPWVVAGR